MSQHLLIKKLHLRVMTWESAQYMYIGDDMYTKVNSMGLLQCEDNRNKVHVLINIIAF